MPVRIQRKRTKGYRLPRNTIYVGRPSKWGNPFKVGDPLFYSDRGMTAYDCRNKYREWLWFGYEALDVNELRGKNLACWCKLSERFCHADVLLEIANP